VLLPLLLLLLLQTWRNTTTQSTCTSSRGDNARWHCQCMYVSTNRRSCPGHACKLLHADIRQACSAGRTQCSWMNAFKLLLLLMGVRVVGMQLHAKLTTAAGIGHSTRTATSSSSTAPMLTRHPSSIRVQAPTGSSIRTAAPVMNLPHTALLLLLKLHGCHAF
jgi:hypothetical protein